MVPLYFGLRWGPISRGVNKERKKGEKKKVPRPFSHFPVETDAFKEKKKEGKLQLPHRSSARRERGGEKKGALANRHLISVRRKEKFCLVRVIEKGRGKGKRRGYPHL